MGIGQFVISIITKNNPALENFVIETLFLKELNSLYIGRSIEIDSKLYFIQVRCPLQILDAQALLHINRVKGNNFIYFLNSAALNIIIILIFY